jgi:hypothetical protein
MPNRSRPPTPLYMPPSILQDHIHAYIALPADHPARVGFRTYGLGLLLSLGPAFLPFVAKVLVPVIGGEGVDRVKTKKAVAGLWRLLRRELGPFGFAFSITTAVAGGSFLQNVFNNLAKPSSDNPLQDCNHELGAATGGLNSAWSIKSRLWTPLSDVQQTFLANALASAVAIVLLQWKPAPGRPQGIPELPLTLPTPTKDISKRKGIPPTLNLTLIFFVRALDSIVHGGLQDKLLQKLKGKEREAMPRSTELEEVMSKDSIRARDWINKWTSTLDSWVFCVCSARCDQSFSYGTPP